MHLLETYYLNQAGRGLPSARGIGPIYSTPIYLQRGRGLKRARRVAPNKKKKAGKKPPAKRARVIKRTSSPSPNQSHNVCRRVSVH